MKSAPMTNAFEARIKSVSVPESFSSLDKIIVFFIRIFQVYPLLSPIIHIHNITHDVF